MDIASYRDLKVWQVAMDLAEAVYQLTLKFPAHQRYGLASQLERAAVSIPANIAEGLSWFSMKWKARRLGLAGDRTSTGSSSLFAQPLAETHVSAAWNREEEPVLRRLSVR